MAYGKFGVNHFTRKKGQFLMTKCQFSYQYLQRNPTNFEFYNYEERWPIEKQHINAKRS